MINLSCDKCGKTFSYEPERECVVICASRELSKGDRTYNFAEDGIYDLCPECMKKIREFLPNQTVIEEVSENEDN